MKATGTVWAGPKGPEKTPENERLRKIIRERNLDIEMLTARVSALQNTVTHLVGDVVPRQPDGMRICRVLSLEDLWQAFMRGALEVLGFNSKRGYGHIPAELLRSAADAYVKFVIEEERAQIKAFAERKKVVDSAIVTGVKSEAGGS